MICTTLQNKGFKEIYELLERPEIEMAEIRLDRCPLGPDEIESVFSDFDLPLVATCRVSEMKGQVRSQDPSLDEDKVEAKAVQLAEAALMKAIDSGAAFVDVEIEAPAMMSKRLRREAREQGTTLIRSYHDFQGTESVEALKAIAEKCLHLGAEIVKIVTTAHNEDDTDRVMSLYNSFAPGQLLAFCMGEEGRRTRLDCLRKGAPYTYAALSEDEAAAPGQWAESELRQALYGKRQGINGPVISMPSSKSFAQRAIIAAAIAGGTSQLYGYSPCGDNESAIAAARALGAEVKVSLSYKDGNIHKGGSTLTINGIGGARFAKSEMHTGESGFLTRMLIPLISCLADGPVRVTGEKTLVNRPLKGAKEIMSAFGVTLESDNDGEAFVPLTIRGKLQSADAEISGKDGSQIISGLLSALPLLPGDTVIRLTEPKSIPYIFITVDVLKAFGIQIESEMEGDGEFAESQDWSLCEAMNFKIRGGQTYKAADLDIEADWSAAANFLVAGAIFGKVALEGLDTASLQADLSIMDILTEAGASLSQELDSKIIHVQKAPLRGFDIDAGNCPDLFPIISVLAAFCQGRSKIGGIGRLSNKESDRGKAILAMLSQMGVRAKIQGDELIVDGMSLSQRILEKRLLHGGDYTSAHDHRMVMALMVASLGADSEIRIDDCECVAKSFPNFIELFKTATSRV